jgi:hypothetical protein
VAEKPGYDDTPQIPDQLWKVHDCERPLPPVVTPGTFSTQKKAGEPPSDAVVLFDGTSLKGWQKRGGGKPGWKVEKGYMEVVPKSGNIETKEQFGDCQLHVEWAAPKKVVGDSQGRGNSGVFLMGIYEIQVLDCFKNPTYADGATAAVYGQFPPMVNACVKPGQWHVYDIVWIGPKFSGDGDVTPARVTVFHNGVLVHHDVTLTGPTTHRTVLDYSWHPPVGPLQLQDHGNPVRFRNIWYRPLKGYDAG